MMLKTAIRKTPNPVSTSTAALSVRWSSRNSSTPPADAQNQAPENGDQPMKDSALKESKKGGKKTKTMAELDEEMRVKMSGLSGDGGEAGIEYEDGKPVAMKRSVKNNMFRYI